MKIKELPKIERPREKLERYGMSRLSDAEIISLILGSGKKGKSALDVAKNILKLFKEKETQSVTLSELKKIPGLGTAKASAILAAFELGRRLLYKKQSQLILKPEDIWRKMDDVRGNKKEHFAIFFLDAQNQVIRREIISIGILNASLVHPREVFEPAILHTSAQIILSHNHPSGNLGPSNEDIYITDRLVKAGKILGIQILDHVIVTKEKWRSMKEKGYLVTTG
ncbi:MAG: DNA repair protein RadC [bacterium]|nr:DNA repair protein RadC [bacterium]